MIRTSSILLALALFLPGPAGEHVAVAVRCDPEVVRPGGWVDVVVEWNLDPGWHATSPRSRSAQSATFECRAPRGFESCARMRATPGRIVRDAVFGDVEEIQGRGELRRRFRVPADADGERRIEGSTSWIVCEFDRCLPPQAFPFDVKLRVSPEGAEGPSYADEATLSDGEKLRIAKEGFALTARGDVDRVGPGEDFLAILDVAAVDLRDPADVRVLESGIRGPVRAAGRPWRVARRSVELGSGKVASRVVLFVPLRVEPEVEGDQVSVRIPWEIAARGSVPPADLRLAIDR